MANELHLSLGLRFSKDGVILNRSMNISVDVAGEVAHQSVQVIGTSEEAVTFPSDMGTVGFVVLHNIATSNFVEVGRTTGVYTIKLLPGEFCVFRLTSGTEFFAKADTGACGIEKILIEL